MPSFPAPRAVRYDSVVPCPSGAYGVCLLSTGCPSRLWQLTVHLYFLKSYPSPVVAPYLQGRRFWGPPTCRGGGSGGSSRKPLLSDWQLLALFTVAPGEGDEEAWGERSDTD